MTYIEYYNTDNKLEITSVLVQEFDYFNFLANNKFKYLFRYHVDINIYNGRLNYITFLYEYENYFIELNKERTFYFTLLKNINQNIKYKSENVRAIKHYDVDTLDEAKKVFKLLLRTLKTKHILQDV